MKRILSLFVSALCAVGAWAEEPLSGEYVDLGLSVKWATCNLGATSSTDAGWYLAWGETSAKTNYTWGTYLSALGGTMTGWSDAGTNKDPLKEYVYGGSHSEGIGGTAYDAATAALGAGYRMPTETEFAELVNTDNCEWVWYDEDNTEFNGVAGYKVTSKKTGYTGNSIFLPAAGYRNGEGLDIEGSNGYYWSSTSVSGGANYAYRLNFTSGNVNPHSYYGRFYGFPVRPVYDGPDPIAQITIGETTTKYYDLEKFESDFYDIEGKANVKLLGDIVFSDYDMIFNEIGANITLDLNGHSIKGANAYLAFIEAKLTITGEGAMESTNDVGLIFNSYGSIVVNDGTYKAVGAICNVTEGKELIINGGKFKAPNLYYGGSSYTKPIVKGGLFSMDPTDCVAEGYEVVANDDEETKGDYPYKVVKKTFAQITIGETTTGYADTHLFKTAIEAIEGVASIKFVDNITEVSSVNLYLSSSSDITIDLNGKSVDNIYFKVSGKLTINDSSEEETGMVTFDPAYPFDVREGAELIINGGSFYGSYYVNGGTGRVILNGGHFKKGSYSTLHEDAILGEGKALKLKDGTIITEITETITQDCEVIDAPSTPTAIESVNAEKSGKVVKTIENGKVVIIRGDKKYDLSGREL